MKSTLISVALLLVSVSFTVAQPLAEVAEKEKERREAIDSSGVKSYDDAALAELRRAIPPRTPSVSPTAESANGEENGGVVMDTEELQEEDPTESRAYWQDRKASIDRRIADIVAQLEEPGFASDPDNLMRRNRLERQLEQARADLAALQSEARRQGVPPGWVR